MRIFGREKEADLIVERLRNPPRPKEFVPYFYIGLMGVKCQEWTEDGSWAKAILCWPNGKRAGSCPYWLACYIQHFQHEIAKFSWRFGRYK